jgi:hypothetical protein
VEITRTFADGSAKVLSNEQFTLSSIGGMFSLGALCGVGIFSSILFVPFFLFSKKKQDG